MTTYSIASPHAIGIAYANDPDTEITDIITNTEIISSKDGHYVDAHTNPSQTSHTLPNFSNRHFASITANYNSPKRDQALVFNSIDEVPQKDYILAVGQIVSPKNITFVSRISNNRFCIFYRIKINQSSKENNHFKCLPLHTQNQEILNALKDVDIIPSSQINYLKAGINIEGYEHIMSFRRQMYINHEDTNKLPGSLTHYADNQYPKLFQDSTPKVATERVDHLPPAKPTQIPVTTDSGFLMDWAHDDTLSMDTIKTPSTPTNTHPLVEKNMDLTQEITDLLSNPLKHNLPPTMINATNDKNKIPLSETSSSQKSPTMSNTPTALTVTNKHGIKKPKKNSLSNSFSQVQESNMETSLKPAHEIFLNTNEDSLSLLQFQYLIENFSNKSINIHSLCKQVNSNIPSIINTIDKVYPKITDRALKFDQIDITNILKQIPTPFIITGDFNSHSTRWGSKSTDRRGKEIEKAFEDDNIVLLNNNEPTHINIANGLMSNINLTLSSASLAQRLEWKVYNNITSSDHFPIIIKYLSRIHDELPAAERWNLKSADWSLFYELLDEEIKCIKDTETVKINSLVNTFTNSILKIANLTIGKSATTNKKPKVPWGNQNIKMAIKDKHDALKKIQLLNTQEDFIELKKLRARTKYLIKTSKKASWENFTSSINENLDTKLVWNKIHSLKGLTRNRKINLIDNNTDLLMNNDLATANKLGEYFYNNSSDKIYKTQFQIYKQKCENETILNNINSNLTDQIHLNKPINFHELTNSGPNNIPYIFIQNFGPKALKLMLKIFNRIFTEGAWPITWKNGRIIPIPKHEKGKFKPEGYRQ
ncbi:hypothetical protein QTP88_022478 [Uroleucon formosanum]